MKERSSNKEFLILEERLNDNFVDNSRVRDIRLDRVKTSLKDSRYILMNLTIDNQNYHSELKVGFEETDDELFEQINKSIKKFIKNLNNDEDNSKKVRKVKK